jgi:hypothetical protein
MWIYADYAPDRSDYRHPQIAGLNSPLKLATIEL